MNRPSDITLPKGWAWETVEAHRAKLDIGENMVPLVTAGGVAAWGTINSVRDLRTKPWSSEISLRNSKIISKIFVP